MAEEKNLGGAPRIYDHKNDKDFDKVVGLCESYFETPELEDLEPGQLPVFIIPTVNGLTLHLGFCNKSTLYDYAKREDRLSNPIKKALTRIEQRHEEGLYGRSPAGHIFALKNSGWKDKTEVETTHKGKIGGSLEWAD